MTVLLLLLCVVLVQIVRCVILLVVVAAVVADWLYEVVVVGVEVARARAGEHDQQRRDVEEPKACMRKESSEQRMAIKK